MGSMPAQRARARAPDDEADAHARWLGVGVSAALGLVVALPAERKGPTHGPFARVLDEHAFPLFGADAPERRTFLFTTPGVRLRDAALHDFVAWLIDALRMDASELVVAYALYEHIVTRKGAVARPRAVRPVFLGCAALAAMHGSDGGPYASTLHVWDALVERGLDLHASEFDGLVWTVFSYAGHRVPNSVRGSGVCVDYVMYHTHLQDFAAQLQHAQTGATVSASEALYTNCMPFKT